LRKEAGSPPPILNIQTRAVAIVCQDKQMRDFGEYLRAYRAYVSSNLGWRKALIGALLWLAGMFVPLWAKALMQLPTWVAITWMSSWALLSYILAPYGMWKHHRAQILSSREQDRK
jgi:hypothetical protein